MKTSTKIFIPVTFFVILFCIISLMPKAAKTEHKESTVRLEELSYIEHPYNVPAQNVKIDKEDPYNQLKNSFGYKNLSKEIYEIKAFEVADNYLHYGVYRTCYEYDYLTGEITIKTDSTMSKVALSYGKNVYLGSQ